MGKAVKIIDIDESGECFVLDEKALEAIFSKVPVDMNVSIVSVVGAFRTGKSFLLDFFLRYLRNTNQRPDLDLEKKPDNSWMTADGNSLEGNNNRIKSKPLDSDDEIIEVKKKLEGFSWKHGTERCTTGIWIWDEYFIRIIPDTNEKVAVFLLDTQGMYDSKTGQHLTASIFGLGTLLSSYTVYNLVFQIQEDHLQHLALFSEYGRVATNEANKHESEEEEQTHMHPFQKLEFLVRDFRNLDLEDDPEDNDLDDLHKQMDTYLQDVLSQKFQKDLKEVRDQIELCYEDVSCFCLPYPGEDVAEKKGYDGSINKVRKHFLYLLGDYVRRVFGERLAVKQIQGQKVTAMQLFEFVKVYCALFKESKIFPEAMTLFRATQEANIAGAIARASAFYKKEMDKVAGPGAQYMKEDRLWGYHNAAVETAIKEFHNATKLGTKEANSEAEKRLRTQLEEKYKDYKESNRLRDPMAFVAPYIVPLMIAFAAWLCRYVLETVCPRRSYACLDFADFFGSLYLVILSFLMFHLVSTMYDVKSSFTSLIAKKAVGLKQD
mmetsp:Transcript_10855/g.14132  ORF Transcript_10855/g.14132 Transcript_10855/m.14132 type:complete len:548 (-) Transcript_10855:96-1739(-)